MNTQNTPGPHADPAAEAPRTALLSNINADYVIRLLDADLPMYHTEGYGDMWGPQLDASSAFSRFAPEAVFLLVDAQQLLAPAQTEAQARQEIDAWYDMFDRCREAGRTYYISDIRLRTAAIEDIDEFSADLIEQYWLACLRQRVEKYTNVHRFTVGGLYDQSGRQGLYSVKSWYTGKVPYTLQGCRALADRVRLLLKTAQRVPKKVLVLDLDNTLWGGVLGEDGPEGIRLSDDGAGAAYKDFQRGILQMQDRGVLLAVCSKNNEQDVRQVMEEHPHMLLRWDAFVSRQINWDDKVDNLHRIAEELNVGLDSLVFVDDMPPERENVRLRLPMVAAPDFPAVPEELPQFAQMLHTTYFQKLRCTAEDTQKTRQYQQNRQRAQAMQGLGFEEYLKGLQLTVERVPNTPAALERAVQLFGKTNQFNLTTKRYTAVELQQRLDQGWDLYIYRVADKFGDYGLVAVILVDTAGPRIDSFLMSCRIMGKRLENCFLDHVERDLLAQGKTLLTADYRPTPKNLPVKEFYPSLGYCVVQQDGEDIRYGIDLRRRGARSYCVQEQ